MSNLHDVRPAKRHKVILSDGVERELRFTLNAMADLEEKFGSVDDAFAAMEKGSIKAIRFVLWTALASSDETLTERQVGNLIDMSNIGELSASMQEAVKQDSPSQKEIAAADPNE